MNKIAQFEKVSFEQFKKDWLDVFPQTNECDLKQIYEDIKLPQRATTGSAGYDFYAPVDLEIKPKTNIKVPTGIRVKIEEGYFLGIFPRSGLGFKFRLQLDNTVGIIDADYYNATNEGHIMAKITCDSNENKSVNITKGNGFLQGIFIPFGITFDDNTDGVRTGGFGSTTK